MNYYQKYLKYKNKYLEFKNQLNIYKNKGPRIIFNPDGEQLGGVLTAEERVSYYNLCNQLIDKTEGVNYNEITNIILQYLKREVLKEISELSYLEPQKEKMRADIEYIFSKIDESDTNYIGKINIVSLQCIMMFTENCIDPAVKFTVNLNNNYDTYLKLRKGDWKDYKNLRENLIMPIEGPHAIFQKYESFSYLYVREEGKKLIYFITILTFFTITEIIESLLNNKIFCGLTSNYTYADGRYLTPFEFLEHDITHGINYVDICFDRLAQSQENIKSFYNYCKTKAIPQEEIYSIKFIIFLLIHETLCEVFPHTKDELYTFNDDFIFEKLTTTSICNMSRFTNSNDLGLSIPKKYRENEKTITAYFYKSAYVYIRELYNWNAETGILK
jgi:hypothetical protein